MYCGLVNNAESVFLLFPYRLVDYTDTLVDDASIETSKRMRAPSSESGTRSNRHLQILETALGQRLQVLAVVMQPRIFVHRLISRGKLFEFVLLIVSFGYYVSIDKRCNNTFENEL
jgi:hypothetical protein